MAVIKNDNSGSANTAENTLLTNLQTPARNSETINTSIEKEKGHGVVPHTPCARYQPRAARLARRKMLNPSETSAAQMNTVSSGLAVMMSQTSPTRVAKVLVLPRMVEIVVAAS